MRLPRAHYSTLTTPSLLTDRANIYKQIAIALKPGAWRKAGLATVISKMVDGGGERDEVEVPEPLSGSIQVSVEPSVAADPVEEPIQVLAEPSADVAEHLVVDHEGDIGVLEEGVGREQTQAQLHAPPEATANVGALRKATAAVMAAVTFQTTPRRNVGVEDAAAASASLIASIFGGSKKRRQRSEAEAEHRAAQQLQAAWRGAQGRVATKNERIGKTEMWAADDNGANQASERLRSAVGLPLLPLGSSAPRGGSSARNASNTSMAQKLPPRQELSA